MLQSDKIAQKYPAMVVSSESMRALPLWHGLHVALRARQTSAVTSTAERRAHLAKREARTTTDGVGAVAAQLDILTLCRPVPPPLAPAKEAGRSAAPQKTASATSRQPEGPVGQRAAPEEPQSIFAQKRPEVAPLLGASAAGKGKGGEALLPAAASGEPAKLSVIMPISAAHAAAPSPLALSPFLAGAKSPSVAPSGAPSVVESKLPLVGSPSLQLATGNVDAPIPLATAATATLPKKADAINEEAKLSLLATAVPTAHIDAAPSEIAVIDSEAGKEAKDGGAAERKSPSPATAKETASMPSLGDLSLALAGELPKKSPVDAAAAKLPPPKANPFTFSMATPPPSSQDKKVEPSAQLGGATLTSPTPSASSSEASEKSPGLPFGGGGAKPFSFTQPAGATSTSLPAAAAAAAGASLPSPSATSVFGQASNVSQGAAASSPQTSAPQAFGKPSSVVPTAFGQPSLGQSSLGQQPSFGQPSFGQSSFGQPSSLGQSALGATAPPPSSFGQTSFGQGTAGQPAFGQPSFGQPAFGQPSFGQPSFGQPSFGQPSFGQPSFGQPSFGQPSFGQTSFGQTSFASGQAPSSGGGQAASFGGGQASSFGQVAASGKSIFGSASSSSAGQQATPFGFASTATAPGAGSPFGAASNVGPPPFGGGGEQKKATANLPKSFTQFR